MTQEKHLTDKYCSIKLHAAPQKLKLYSSGNSEILALEKPINQKAEKETSIHSIC